MFTLKELEDILLHVENSDCNFWLIEDKELMSKIENEINNLKQQEEDNRNRNR